MSEPTEINIKGAKVNNLKNISLSIPRNKFIVISGVSGSGRPISSKISLVLTGPKKIMRIKGY